MELASSPRTAEETHIRALRLRPLFLVSGDVRPRYPGPCTCCHRTSPCASVPEFPRLVTTPPRWITASTTSSHLELILKGPNKVTVTGPPGVETQPYVSRGHTEPTALRDEKTHLLRIRNNLYKCHWGWEKNKQNPRWQEVPGDVTAKCNGKPWKESKGRKEMLVESG